MREPSGQQWRILVFVRHGKTDAAVPNEARQLTQKGRVQVARLAGLLEALLAGERFDLVLVAPLDRTRETAKLLAPGVPVLEVPELWTPPSPEEKEEMQRLFQILGNAPLIRHFQADSSGVMKRFAAGGAEAVEQAIKETGARRVLIVGSCVLQQAVASALIGSAPLLNEVLGEAEGFNLRPDGTVEFIRQPAT